ncbi:hypothetical protein FGB62_13g243 [Gracilaria domingensis]|nr:hypothetical protein FGB62_13g243 [Gracilaria domingensis]
MRIREQEVSRADNRTRSDVSTLVQVRDDCKWSDEARTILGGQGNGISGMHCAAWEKCVIRKRAHHDDPGGTAMLS